MADKTQKRREAPRGRDEARSDNGSGTGAEARSRDLRKRSDELAAEIDAAVEEAEAAAAAREEDDDTLTDEIEDLLETDAEEFVKNYVQRGGE